MKAEKQMNPNIMAAAAQRSKSSSRSIDGRSELAKQVGERLATARISRGLSQEDLAVTCDVTRAAVSQWERGGTLADKRNINRMAARLRVPAEWLENGENPPELVSVYPNVKTKIKARVTRRRQPELSRTPFTSAVPEMQNGLGSGVSYGTEAQVHDWWRIPPDAINSLRVRAEDLRAYRVLSDGVDGVRVGTTVIVDLSQTEPVDGCFFVIDLGVALVLKKVTVDLLHRSVKLVDRAGSVELPKNGNRKTAKILGRCVAQFSSL